MEVLPTQERLLTRLDHARLSTLLFRPRFATELPDGLAEAASELLDNALLVEATAIDGDVVTMRSAVELERPSLGSSTVHLVYPDESDPRTGCISVLTPMGLALLGARLGHDVTWWGPDRREHRATLQRMVYQPEASGDYLR